jgi:hypothetical protein
MFDLVSVHHDAVLSRALEIRNTISSETIANAFLASLSSRRMDWRSPLGSLSAILHLPSHSFTHWEGARACGVCGGYPKQEALDVSILNFERLKWGGVRHEQPHYAVLDLEWFGALIHPSPLEEDLAILRAVVSEISRLPGSARPGHIEEAIKGLFPANASERRQLISILGLAGILIPNGRPTFWREYPFRREREGASGKNDWSYPVLWWTGGDGINRDALKYWFPKL